jgi:hypothetical protein
MNHDGESHSAGQKLEKIASNDYQKFTLYIRA